MGKFLLFKKIAKEAIASGFIVFLLSLLALHEGIGYQPKTVKFKTHVIKRYHMDLGGGFDQGLGYYIYLCSATVHLNPIFYPLSYAIGGGEASATVKGLEGPILTRNTYYETLESAKFTAAFSQFYSLNILYIVAISFLIKGALSKLRRTYFKILHFRK